MGFIRALVERIDNSMREVNSPHWSLTKVGIIIFMYPAITAAFVYDTYVNQSLDWVNMSVFITGITAPRMISQILAARFGYQSKDGKVLAGDNAVDASPQTLIGSTRRQSRRKAEENA